MLIKQFCTATGLPRETVRFYVKRGLLKPDVGSGDGNRYQVFDAAQVERAEVIKIAQRLGFSLRQIASFADAYEADDLGAENKVAVLQAQIVQITEHERELRRMRKYLTAKLDWLRGGEAGSAPSFTVARSTGRKGGTQSGGLSRTSDLSPHRSRVAANRTLA